MTDHLKRYIVEYVANGQSLDSPVVYTDQIMAHSHDEAVRRLAKVTDACTDHRGGLPSGTACTAIVLPEALNSHRGGHRFSLKRRSTSSPTAS